MNYLIAGLLTFIAVINLFILAYVVILKKKWVKEIVVYRPDSEVVDETIKRFQELGYEVASIMRMQANVIKIKFVKVKDL